jgi:hypothetical protein
MRTKYITTITVTDPDTELPVEVEIRKDMDSGAMIGIDGSYLENTDNDVYSPYNFGEVLEVPDDEEIHHHVVLGSNLV